MGAGAGLAQGANDMKEKTSLLHETASKPLLEYLTAASLLATNHEDYRKAVNVSESDYNDLKTVPGLELDQLLTVQNDIKDHCSKFKDTTYPAIIKLASDVHRYARKVGGKPQSSYYGNLVTQLQLLEDAQAKNDTATVDTCKKHIFSLCDVAIKEAAGIAASSDAAAKALDHFATLCDQDKKNLGDRKNAISRALDGLDSEKGKGGLIKQRRDEIEEQGKLWWKNYREFVIATTAAATSVLWLLIPCYGLIIMPIAAGVGSEEAKKLHKAMDDCNALIEKDGKEIERYMRLSHDINVVSTRTKSLYDLIEPAKQVVLRNKGTWEAIASDVSGIKKAVEENKAETPDSYMGGISVDSLILVWNDVAQLADDFRLNAYTTAEVKDTDEAELKKQLDSIVRDHGEEPK